MTLETADLVKLLLAALVGGLVGAEREFHDKSAGFRTMICICVGATLFTIFSVKLPGDHDPARVAANIVTGIGFLGAGAILRDGGRVLGLTTAATIWLVAALGMGIGAEQYALVGAATAIVLLVLVVFPRLEWWIDRRRETRIYRVVCALVPDCFERLDQVFRDCGLHVRLNKHMKRGDEMIGVWHVAGKPERHDQLIETFISDPEIRELHF